MSGSFWSQTSLGALYSSALLRLQSNRHLLQNQRSGQENEITLTFRFISFTGAQLPLVSDTLIPCGPGDWRVSGVWLIVSYHLLKNGNQYGKLEIWSKLRPNLRLGIGIKKVNWRMRLRREGICYNSGLVIYYSNWEPQSPKFWWMLMGLL